MRADGVDPAAVHHDDLVCILYGRNALGDDDLRNVWDLLAEGLADHRVRLGVDGAGRVVEDEHLRIFQKGARDAQALFLPARNVGAALLDVGVVLIGERLDEVVRAGEAADAAHFVVGRVLLAPAQVVLDGAGEQNVLLQDHGDLVAERFEVVVLDIDPADVHGALRRVVQARDEVDEGGFGSARTAQNADRLTRFDVQIDAGKRKLFRVFRIFETDVIEDDVAVFDLGDRVFGGNDAALFLQNRHDTFGGGTRDDHHDENHRKLHDGGKNLRGVHDERRQIAARHGAGNVVRLHRLPRNDRREQEDEQESEPYAELHDRPVDRHDALGEGEVFADVLGSRLELFLFKVLAHEGFDDADALDVLADGAVHVVVLVEHLFKDGVRLQNDEHEHRGEHGHERQKYPRDGDVDRKGHDEREDEHERAADRHADDHHVRHLHVGHVRRLAGNQRRGGKAVDIRERIVLDRIVHILAQVLRKACARAGGEPARQHARGER